MLDYSKVYFLQQFKELWKCNFSEKKLNARLFTFTVLEIFEDLNIFLKFYKYFAIKITFSYSFRISNPIKIL